MNRMMSISLSVLVVSIVCAEDTWRLTKPGTFGRDAKAIAEVVGDEVKVTFDGQQDWALHGMGRVPVKSWESFKLSVQLKGKGHVDLSVVTYDDKGKAINWSFGTKSLQLSDAWQLVETKVIVPKGVAHIEPRLMGFGAVSFSEKAFTLSRNQEQFPVKNGKYAFGAVEIIYSEEGFKLNAKGYSTGFSSHWLVLDAAQKEQGVSLKLLNVEDSKIYRAGFTLEKEELVVELNGDGPLSNHIVFPPAFTTSAGDLMILPENEGMGYPVDELDLKLYSLILFGGHGLCMSFYGVTADTTGAGWMALVETPDDVSVIFSKQSGRWQVATEWLAQKQQFGYVRKVRYAFFDKGGHVAMCKRYRQYAKDIGRLKTFTEKVKERPAVDQLIGAANIWFMDNAKLSVQVAKEMQAAGLERLLWSANGPAEQIAAMNTMPHVLTSRYDIYSDVMDPANFPLLRWKHSDWTTGAFPQDITWDKPDGTLRQAWGVERKDGNGMVHCVSLCDRQSLPYARERIKKELETKLFKCRFIDTATACSWQECWNPAHPMTRTDSREARIKLLNVVSKECGLVCGSETGHDAVVPVCDYFEGMLSIGRYRVPDAGRKMQEIWDDVPVPVEEFQVGEKYRLPLWELVYHDCVVAQWYWGDYNNKLPKIWRKRDLFNALYGTPPMYMFSSKMWMEMKDRFAASYKIAQPVSRMTGYSEMTDHQILTPNRTVQRTIFANGVMVTVNFGKKPFTTTEGDVIAPLDLKIVPKPKQ
ncbi:MAG: glycoside hydrolase [bacterium]